MQTKRLFRSNVALVSNLLKYLSVVWYDLNAISSLKSAWNVLNSWMFHKSTTGRHCAHTAWVQCQQWAVRHRSERCFRLSLSLCNNWDDYNPLGLTLYLAQFAVWAQTEPPIGWGFVSRLMTSVYYASKLLHSILNNSILPVLRAQCSVTTHSGLIGATEPTLHSTTLETTRLESSPIRQHWPHLRWIWISWEAFLFIISTIISRLLVLSSESI